MTEFEKVAPKDFWALALKSNQSLEHVIRAVDSGNLRGAVVASVLQLNLDHFRGQAPAPAGSLGVINMNGPILPYLPTNGTFDMVLTQTTAVLTIKDANGVPYPPWVGNGMSTVPAGNYSGPWVRDQ